MRGMIMAASVAVLAIGVVPAKGASRSGLASWYYEGARVACGNARFDPDGLTAASRELPCGARVTVTNRRNGRSVTVIINDFGPARWTHRMIDLSRGAARRLDMLAAGVVPVDVEALQ